MLHQVATITHDDGSEAPVFGIVTDHLSYSQITNWLHCGEQYRLTRVAKLQEHPSWWLAGGSAVHEATEAYDLGKKWTNPKDMFTKHFEANRPVMDGRFEGLQPRASGRGKEDDAWWLANGPNMVQRWIDWREKGGWTPLDMAQVTGKAKPHPSVELDITGTIAGHKVVAYLDRVMVNKDGEAMILDIKSGGRKPDSNLQLGFYSNLLSKKFGVQITTGAYWMARKGEVPEVVDLTKYDERLLERMVVGLAKAKMLGVYIPNVTNMCKSCAVNYACAAWGGEEAPKWADVGLNPTPFDDLQPPF